MVYNGIVYEVRRLAQRDLLAWMTLAKPMHRRGAELSTPTISTLRSRDYEAIENKDYESFTKNLVNGRLAKEHIIKLDIAKEMAMLERNEKPNFFRRKYD